MKKFLVLLTTLLAALLATRALLTRPLPRGPEAVAPSPLSTIIKEEGKQARLIKDISAKEDLLGLTYSPDEKRVFVTSFDEGKIYVIDTSQDAIVGEIKTAVGPYGIAFIRSKNELAVSGGKNSLLFLEPESGQQIASVDVGNKPLDLGLDPAEKYLFTANAMDDTVSVVDLSKKQTIKTIPVGHSPQRLFINQTGQWLFVLNQNPANISVISVPALSLTATITPDGNPTSLIDSDQQGKIYLLDSWTNELVTLNNQSYQEIARLPLPELPVDAALSLSQKRLYVLSFAKNSLSVINLEKQTTENQLTFSQRFLPETGLNRLLLLPTLQKLYLLNTNFGKVLVVSLR